MSKFIQIVVASIISLIIAVITIYFTVFYNPPRTVEGTVRTKSTKQPISGVEVYIGENKIITTDDGIFVFEKTIREGYHEIKTHKEGYKDYSGTIKVKGNIERDILIEPLILSEIPLEITIDNPTDGSYVGLNITVTGTSSGDYSDFHLWVVVHPIGSSGYWPQVSEIIPNRKTGQWAQPVNLGTQKDKGKSFEIIVVSANQSANNSFNNYLAESKINNKYPEVPLPQGINILTLITVIRK